MTPSEKILRERIADLAAGRVTLWGVEHHAVQEWANKTLKEADGSSEPEHTHGERPEYSTETLLTKIRGIGNGYDWCKQRIDTLEKRLAQVEDFLRRQVDYYPSPSPETSEFWTCPCGYQNPEVMPICTNCRTKRGERGAYTPAPAAETSERAEREEVALGIHNSAPAAERSERREMDADQFFKKPPSIGDYTAPAASGERCAFRVEPADVCGKLRKDMVHAAPNWRRPPDMLGHPFWPPTPPKEEKCGFTYGAAVCGLPEALHQMQSHPYTPPASPAPSGGRRWTLRATAEGIVVEGPLLWYAKIGGGPQEESEHVEVIEAAVAEARIRELETQLRPVHPDGIWVCQVSTLIDKWTLCGLGEKCPHRRKFMSASEVDSMLAALAPSPEGEL